MFLNVLMLVCRLLLQNLHQKNLIPVVPRNKLDTNRKNTIMDHPFCDSACPRQTLNSPQISYAVAGNDFLCDIESLASFSPVRPTEIVYGAMVDEKTAQAIGLGYKADATKVNKKNYPKYVTGQKCSGCVLFRGKAGDAQGKCPLFGDKEVSAKGWCSAWAKKA
jgi:hypothetical protein